MLIRPGMYQPTNLLSQWARLLIESLCDAGVDRAIISPGSRSTPLVAAVQRCTRMRHQIVVDERCAGFMALGHAKRTGSPALLICTSGTAAAHYFPALIEADLTHTPMLVLSADRPPELQHNGAPQTIEQQQLFGRKVRHFSDLGLAGSDDDSLRALRRKATQAVALTQSPLPGPVHLNFPARKPLEPDFAAVRPAESPEAQLQQRVSDLLATPARFFGSAPVPAEAAVEAVLEHANRCQRPALLLGSTSPSGALDAELLCEFSARSGWPLLAEATSQHRYLKVDSRHRGVAHCDAFDLVYRATPVHPQLVPDFVLQLGSTPTSSAWAALTKHHSMRRVVVSAHGLHDPSNTAVAHLSCDENALLGRLSGCVNPATTTWRGRMLAANQQARLCIAEELTREDPEFDEGDAVAILGDALQAGDQLLIGNSLPVRLADTFLRARELRIPVISQRGASGIDGLISVAVGAARSAGRTYALIGDVSALHDIGGLLALSQTGAEVSLVVLNNGGGRIFEQLPLADDRDAPGSLDAWTTPHQIDLSQIGSAYGIPTFRAEGPEALGVALKLSRRTGPNLVEVPVAPQGAAAKYRRLVAELVPRLRQILPKPS